MIKLVRKWNQTVEKIDKIFTEVTPNNGSSIKDIINSIDKKLVEFSEMQKAVLADDDKALFKTDVDGNCNWVNRTYSRTVERMPSELMDHGWQNAIAQEDREYVVKSWYNAVKERREFTASFTFETPGGRRIPAVVRSYKMTNSRGEVIGYLGSISILETN